MSVNYGDLQSYNYGPLENFTYGGMQGPSTPSGPVSPPILYAPTWTGSSIGATSLSIPTGAADAGDLMVLQSVGIAIDNTFTWGRFSADPGWTLHAVQDDGHGVHMEIWSKTATSTDVGSSVTFNHGTVSSSNFNLYGACWGVAVAVEAQITVALGYDGNSGSTGSTGPLLVEGDVASDRYILGIAARDSSLAMTQITHNFGTNFVTDAGSDGLWNSVGALDAASGSVVSGAPSHQASIAYNIKPNCYWEWAGIRVVSVAAPLVAIPARLATIVG